MLLSGDDVVDDLAAHIGQADVAATVMERQLFMVEGCDIGEATPHAPTLSVGS